jgi:hypothetical protein
MSQTCSRNWQTLPHGNSNLANPILGPARFFTFRLLTVGCGVADIGHALAQLCTPPPGDVSPTNCIKFPVAAYALSSMALQRVMRRYRGWLPVAGHERRISTAQPALCLSGPAEASVQQVH